MLWGFKNSNQNNIIYILIKIVNILKTYKLSWNCWHLLDGRLMQSTCSFYVCFILQMYVHRGFIHTDVCSTKFHTLWCMFWVYRNPLLNFFRSCNLISLLTSSLGENITQTQTQTEKHRRVEASLLLSQNLVNSNCHFFPTEMLKEVF